MINIPISNNEVPELREVIGWSRRDEDYPTLFERCNFWAGVRNEHNKLIVTVTYEENNASFYKKCGLN